MSSLLCYHLHSQDEMVREFGPGPVNYSNININDAAWNRTLMLYINTKEANLTLNMETPFCRHTERFDYSKVPRSALCEAQNGTGPYNILVIGNSYAFNQADVIYNAFRNHSRELTFFSFSGCEFLMETNPKICQYHNYNYSFILHALKPDIVFVLTRPLDGRVRFDPMKPIDEDKIFNDYMNRINQVEEVAKKDGLIKRDEVFVRERITEVGKRCKKCEIIDYLTYLVDDDGQYLGYNPKTNIMYYDTINHFNRFGKERIQALYNRLANELEAKGIQ
ncbi:hypothetical protein Y032_0002g1026 [Ancylostoma ceylanicum]|uniref:SGNH domain-containing protein n=1 Tax=Ancylostoma ceylanicum TaxID=53326 RepID=A0A016W067_9BILA|nr:hypothetical protein Y032_0002g1026 [Ancylostoma ceylanicum]